MSPDDDLPLAKPLRVRDPRVLDWARRRGRCEHCERLRATEPHHVKTRGAGGGDTMENVVALCRECHDLAHWGHVRRTTLLALIAAR